MRVPPALQHRPGSIVTGGRISSDREDGDGKTASKGSQICTHVFIFLCGLLAILIIFSNANVA